MGQEPTSGVIQGLAVAESVVAREEAVSRRAFDPSFRARAKELLATLPVAELESQTGEGGLGLNSLGDSQADLVYTPLTPCRIIDTRIAGGVLAVGTPRSFLVTGTDLSSQGGSATGCGVPFGPATAAVINFVAVNPAGLGNLRVTPFGTAIPLASIINYAAGLTIANGPAVAMCDPSATTCSNDITIQANASATHLVADVQGYFRRVAVGGVGTALLADSAVTAPKIGSGVVVRSLNAQTDTVTLAGTNGLSVSQGSGTVTVASNATPANAAGAIVSRDGWGSFSAGSVGLAGNLDLPNTTSPSVGMITLGGSPFLHNFGSENTFVGTDAGNTGTTGANNSGFGTGVLFLNSTGFYNSAFGSQALHSNTTGTSASAFGANALYNNTTGVSNSAVGSAALYSNTTGSNNSAFGQVALYNNTTGDNNSAVGQMALFQNTTGHNNSAFGLGALLLNSTGYNNSAVGQGALSVNSTGYNNSAFGQGALNRNTTGHDNSAFGFGALPFATGWNNTAIGYGAGANLTSGNNNIYIVAAGVAGDSSVIRIGTVGTQTATFIAGISGVTPASPTLPVVVNANGQLGTGSATVGDITAVNTPGRGGLQGGVESGDANLGLVRCEGDQILKSDGESWSCAKDVDTDTGVNAVTGGGGITGSIATRTLTLGSTASSANAAAAIVARDGSGNFSAGTITASLAGNATSATTAGSFSGSLGGEVTGTQASTVVSNAVATNTASAIVRRNLFGDFSAGTVGLAGNLELPNTTSSPVGVLTKGGTPFLHNFGGNNTFVGSRAGNFILTGTNNSAFGYRALNANTTGNEDTAFGAGALQTNTEGQQNSAVGYMALFSNTTGDSNSAFGLGALLSNTTGYQNSAFGNGALSSNTTGGANSAFGIGALSTNTTGYENVATGLDALASNTTGHSNSAFGSLALTSNTTGGNNSALGYDALNLNTTGYFNSAVGFRALHSNTTGTDNSAFGDDALRQLSNGDGNIAVGGSAGYQLTSGSSNIYIGNQGTSIESNTIRIGTLGTQTATFIAGIFNVATGIGIPVYVAADGKLGTAISSRRYKEQIADMDAESDVLMKLRPVSFYYRPELDDTHTRQYGLVAEEVAEIAPELVLRDETGAPQTVRYHFVNAMLLNEVQKQRRHIQDLEARLARLEAALAGDR